MQKKDLLDSRKIMAKNLTLALASGALVTLGSNIVYANEGVVPTSDVVVVDTIAPVSQDLPSDEIPAPTEEVLPTTPEANDEVLVPPTTDIPIVTETPAETTENIPEDTETTTESETAEQAQEDENPKRDTEAITEQPKSSEQANQQGTSQVGTISSATGQVVQNVTPEAPVQTNTGASIVSTQNGQIILSDGSTVAPEAIGAVTNADKTITVTKIDGTKATLPETGEATSFLATMGTGLFGLVGLLLKKKLV